MQQKQHKMHVSQAISLRGTEIRIVEEQEHAATHIDTIHRQVGHTVEKISKGQVEHEDSCVS